MQSVIARYESVALDEIQDLDWPTDSRKVQEFQQMIRSDGPPPAIRVNRVWHADATWHYEIIDGLHRYAAAKAEGLTDVVCEVMEWSQEKAFTERAKATLDKPAAITRARAVKAIGERFVGEMLDELRHVSLLEPIITDDGTISSREYQAPLPSDQKDLLLVITNHFLAREIVAGRSLEEIFVFQRHGLGKGSVEVKLAIWEQKVDTWITEKSACFGIAKEELRSTMFGGEPNSSYRREIPLNALFFDSDIRSALSSLGKKCTTDVLDLTRLREIAFFWGMPSAGLEHDTKEYGRRFGYRQRPLAHKTQIIRQIESAADFLSLWKTLRADYIQWEEQEDKREQEERHRQLAIKEEEARKAFEKSAEEQRVRLEEKRRQIAQWEARINADEDFAFHEHERYMREHKIYRQVWKFEVSRRKRSIHYVERLRSDHDYAHAAALEMVRTLLLAVHTAKLDGWLPIEERGAHIFGQCKLFISDALPQSVAASPVAKGRDEFNPVFAVAPAQPPKRSVVDQYSFQIAQIQQSLERIKTERETLRRLFPDLELILSLAEGNIKETLQDCYRRVVDELKKAA